MGRLAARAAVALSVLLALAALLSLALEKPLPPPPKGNLRLYKISERRQDGYAVRILARAAERPLTDSYPFVQLAWREIAARRYDEAQRLLRKAAARDDDGLDALADFALERGRLDVLENALADRPENHARALVRGRLLLARGRKDEALALFKIVEFSAEPGRAHLEIGRALIALGRPEEGCARVLRAAGLLERQAYPDAEACRARPQ